MKIYTLIIILILLLAGLIYLGFFNNPQPKQSESSHIYLGAVYDGQVIHASSVSARLTYGGGSNIKGIQYYVVLSVWDSNNSYDQIGISSIDGFFFSTYSYTELVNGTIKYIYDPTWFRINDGTHNISMSISLGYVNFIFDNRSIREFTGGDFFVISKSIEFDQREYTDFTAYEEIYKYDGKLPSIEFNFTSINFNANQEIYPFKILTQNISTYQNTIVIYKNTVNIYNKNPLSLSVEIKSPSGSGYINVADLNESIQPNKIYKLFLVPGYYKVTINFNISNRSYVFIKYVNLYNNTQLNQTITS